MRITVSGLSFGLTPALVEHVRRRMERSLATASDQISAVSVRLADINGNHGGIDKTCRVIVWMRNLRAVVAEAVDRDLYAAVDEAATRARQGVWRHVERRRTLRRQHANRVSSRLLG